MAAKIIAFVCLQLALFNTIKANCVNRFIPGLQQNILPMPLPVAETLLPNQMIIGPNYGPPIMEVPYGMETIMTNQLPATTIIQDSTVANNLANALQLLVVSNLLSNTLPLSSPDVIVPGLGCGSPLDYGIMSPVGPVMSPISPVMSPIGPVMSPIGPVMSPISPIMSPINPCGFGPYNYVY